MTLVQYGTSELAISEQVGTAVIRMNNLQPNGWDFTDLKYIEIEEHKKELLLLQKGDILFNRTNSKELVGKCEVFQEDGEWIFASYLIRVRLDEDKALPHFVSEFLNTKAGRIQIDRISRQIIGMTNVNAEELRDLLVPLPPKPIQEKLVKEMERARESRRRKLFEADALLSTLDGWLLDTLGITPPPADNRKIFAVKLNDLNNRLDVHANQSRFRELFKRLNEMPFEVLPLSKLTTTIFSGTTPKVGSDSYVESPNGIAFVRSGEIGKDGVVSVSNEIHISNETHEKKMKSSQLKRDDILIAIVGATIGNVGVYDSDEPANINQAIASVRLNGVILPKYLVCYLKSKLGQQVLDYLKRPVARANINLDEIGSILVPVVSKELQETIVDKFNELREESQRLKSEAESEWQAAKDWFEAQLLAGDKK